MVISSGTSFPASIHAFSIEARRIGLYGAASRFYGLTVRPVYGTRVAVAAVTLDQGMVTMNEGDELQLTASFSPANPSERNVDWSSSDETVAVVVDGLVRALFSGQATIIASSVDGGKHTTCKVTVESVMPEKVDMGLSVMWADRNIGASAPEKCGLHYGWGEQFPSKYYYWRYYKFAYYIMNYNNTGYEYMFLSKYNSLEEEGTVDNLTELLPEDDTAHIKYGDKWKMPSMSQMQELLDTRNNSDYRWEWTSMGEMNGWKVTYLANGNSIFLPAAGRWNEDVYSNKGATGSYWTTALYASNPYRAYAVWINDSGAVFYQDIRCGGLSIRPVYGD